MKAVGPTLLAAATLLVGCAQIEVYSDAKLETRTGVPFYVAKPYLLVARTGSKDKPVDVSVVYVPDLSKPYYAKLSPGIGSSKLAMQFTNSVLTSVNQEGDTKLTDLITALGGVPGQLANAAKTRKETSLLGPQAAPDYSALARKLNDTADDIDKQVLLAKNLNALTGVELTAIGTASKIARSAAKTLGDPTQAEQGRAKVILDLKNATKNWDDQVKPTTAGLSAAAAATRRQLDTLRTQLQDVIDALADKPEDPPTFTLYELDNSGGATVLKEVKF